ncbi:MAG: hypothetical protein LBT65_04085, partial [Synergistaceae bacterium]|nr:hypothetical protein [Synergistaceae bacterium]
MCFNRVQHKKVVKLWVVLLLTAVSLLALISPASWADEVLPPPEHIPADTRHSGTSDALPKTGGFSVGETRQFSAQIKPSNFAMIDARLIAQGGHTNIWLLDDEDFHKVTGTGHDENCTLKSFDAKMAREMADTFDGIYVRMTDETTGFARHEGVIIKLGLPDLDEIGDLGNDGKVNLLLYDILGDGSETGDSSWDGYFSNGDFFTALDGGINYLDMFHIDVGKNHGFASLADPNKKWDVYSYMAHEFQHLLCYMYFHAYVSANEYDEYIKYGWFDDSLAAAASVFYTIPDSEMIGDSVFGAAGNSYANSGYGDFVNHNGSGKNYGMGGMLSRMLHKQTGGLYVHKVFEHFKKTYPPGDGYEANSAKFNGKDMDEVIGEVFNSVLGWNESTGKAAFARLYYLFM